MSAADAVVAEVWGLIERECLSNLSRKWAEGGGSKTTVALLVELAGEHLRAEREQYLEQTAAWVERELSKLKLNGNAEMRDHMGRELVSNVVKFERRRAPAGGPLLFEVVDRPDGVVELVIVPELGDRTIIGYLVTPLPLTG